MTAGDADRGMGGLTVIHTPGWVHIGLEEQLDHSEHIRVECASNDIITGRQQA